MNRAVVPAGDKQVATRAKRKTCGIDQRSHERLHGITRADFIKGNGNTLAARPAECHINIAFGIHGGIADRMQIVRNLKSKSHGKRLALFLRIHDLDVAAAGVFRDARDQAVAAGQGQRRLRLAETHQRPRTVPRRKPAAKNRDFTTRNGGGGRNPFDVGNAVLLCGGAKPEFHTFARDLQPMKV